jgi:hypothetical protein
MLIINNFILKEQTKNITVVTFDVFKLCVPREFIGAIINIAGKPESAFSRFF